MEQKWNDYIATLKKELGDDNDLAEEFVDSLYQQSEGSAEIASGFFQELGRIWAPLMNLWSYWIMSMAEGEIALILRDAKPLEVIKGTTSWKKLYLNRSNCGIDDELAQETSTPHPLLKKYLVQNSCSKYFTFVDTGCYGTIVLELFRLGIKFKPLFFWSKNPSIPGFLNQLGLSEEEGTILNDSLECAFPNKFERPKVLVEIDNVVTVEFKPADELSVLFCESALKGVREFEFNYDSNHRGLTEAKKLLDLSRQAREGFFTGILGFRSPEWKGKKEFLEKWPKNLHFV